LEKRGHQKNEKSTSVKKVREIGERRERLPKKILKRGKSTQKREKSSGCAGYDKKRGRKSLGNLSLQKNRRRGQKR